MSQTTPTTPASSAVGVAAASVTGTGDGGQPVPGPAALPVAPMLGLDDITPQAAMASLEKREQMVILRFNTIAAFEEKTLSVSPTDDELKALANACENQAKARLEALKDINDEVAASNPFGQVAPKAVPVGSKSSWLSDSELQAFPAATHSPVTVPKHFLTAIEGRFYVPLTAFTAKAVRGYLEKAPETVVDRTLDGTKVTIPKLADLVAAELTMTKAEWEEAWSIYVPIMEGLSDGAITTAMWAAWHRDLTALEQYSTNFDVVLAFDIKKRKSFFFAPKPFLLSLSDFTNEFLSFTITMATDKILNASVPSQSQPSYQGGPERSRRPHGQSTSSFPSGSGSSTGNRCVRCGRASHRVTACSYSSTEKGSAVKAESRDGKLFATGDRSPLCFKFNAYGCSHSEHQSKGLHRCSVCLQTEHGAQACSA